MTWLLALAIGSGIAACSTPPTLDAVKLAEAAEATLAVVDEQAAAAETLTATALWPTDTPTPTNTPTATSTATATSSSTPTATPLPSGTVIAADSLRMGPGAVYPVAARLAGGETARPVGQTEAGDWLLIVLESGEEGWLPAANFAVEAGSAPLQIIRDLPPTPTQPPATITPTIPPPTATRTPSPYTCDMQIQHSSYRGYVILTGQGWPPGVDIDLTIISTHPYTGAPLSRTRPAFIRSGDANSPTPNGFWMTFQGGTATYTASTEACTTTVTGP